MNKFTYWNIDVQIQYKSLGIVGLAQDYRDVPGGIQIFNLIAILFKS